MSGLVCARSFPFNGHPNSAFNLLPRECCLIDNLERADTVKIDCRVSSNSSQCLSGFFGKLRSGLIFGGELGYHSVLLPTTSASIGSLAFLFSEYSVAETFANWTLFETLCGEAQMRKGVQEAQGAGHRRALRHRPNTQNSSQANDGDLVDAKLRL